MRARCVRGKKGDPVAIGRLERFAADFERNAGVVETPAIAPPTGSGWRSSFRSLGTHARGDLAKLGQEVVVFEALHKPGGVLVYGTPNSSAQAMSRPRWIISENSASGSNSTASSAASTRRRSLSEALARSMWPRAGAPCSWHSRRKTLAASSAPRVSHPFEPHEGLSLPRIRHTHAEKPQGAVLGGGNVAMDAARTALRLGRKGYDLYRRTEAEIPPKEEVHHAGEEGSGFHTSPRRWNSRRRAEHGPAVKCSVWNSASRTIPGAADGAGTRSEFEGRPIRWSWRSATSRIRSYRTRHPSPLNRRRNIVADETGRRAREGVFAGGDIVTGAHRHPGHGSGEDRRRAIHGYLMNRPILRNK